MDNIASKNGLREKPEIYLDQFLTNDQLDVYMAKFEANEISVEDYIEEVLRHKP